MTEHQQVPAVSQGTWALNLTWAMLMALALGSYLLAAGALEGKGQAYLAFGIAFVKLTLVSAVFMELWHRGRGFFWIALGLFAATLGLMAGAWI